MPTKNYRITLSSGEVLTMDAAQVVQDGLGTKVVNSLGQSVAVFAHGEVKSAVPIGPAIEAEPTLTGPEVAEEPTVEEPPVEDPAP